AIGLDRPGAAVTRKDAPEARNTRAATDSSAPTQPGVQLTRPLEEPKRELPNLIGMRLSKRLAVFMAIVQSLLLAVHLLVYKTWQSRNPENDRWALAIFGLLAFSFVSASVLAFRYHNPAVRAFYAAAAIWLGMLTFVVSASALAWLVLALSS